MSEALGIGSAVIVGVLIPFVMLEAIGALAGERLFWWWRYMLGLD